MRGSSLSSPAALEALRPFIVAVWDGRPDDEMPSDVREVYEEARRTPRQTNILLCVLDSQGKLVRAFPPFPGQHPGSLGFDPQRMGNYLKEQIQQSTVGMKLPQVAARTTLTLPDVEGTGQPAGVRIFVSFKANQIGQFRVPAVEAVPMRDSEREALRLPTGPRTVPAVTLRRWLEQFYPPGIMDGYGGFDRIAGSLQLTPAGTDTTARYAVLQGDVQFTLDNRNAAAYSGRVEILLEYGLKSDALAAVRGVMEGNFPREDRFGRANETVRMTAAIESRPR